MDTNDFYSDNMVLGALGSVVGYVYESFTSTPDAMDASLMQFAKERIKLMSSHRDAYDEAPHMNDSFALADLVVTRAERRQTQVTKDYDVCSQGSQPDQRGSLVWSSPGPH